MTFNVELVELVNGDLEVVVKVVEVQNLSSPKPGHTTGGSGRHVAG